jgi:peptidoglycan/LPS O-acetylase OafA/YrhL
MQDDARFAELYAYNAWRYKAQAPPKITYVSCLVAHGAAGVAVARVCVSVCLCVCVSLCLCVCVEVPARCCGWTLPHQHMRSTATHVRARTHATARPRAKHPGAARAARRAGAH